VDERGRIVWYQRDETNPNPPKLQRARNAWWWDAEFLEKHLLPAPRFWERFTFVREGIGELGVALSPF
jgi:hypothetical protein